eukprot:3578919-Amphidinium_carterae.1
MTTTIHYCNESVLENEQFNRNCDAEFGFMAHRANTPRTILSIALTASGIGEVEDPSVGCAYLQTRKAPHMNVAHIHLHSIRHPVNVSNIVCACSKHSPNPPLGPSGSVLGTGGTLGSRCDAYRHTLLPLYPESTQGVCCNPRAAFMATFTMPNPTSN